MVPRYKDVDCACKSMHSTSQTKGMYLILMILNQIQIIKDFSHKRLLTPLNWGKSKTIQFFACLFHGL